MEPGKVLCSLLAFLALTDASGKKGTVSCCKCLFG